MWKKNLTFLVFIMMLGNLIAAEVHKRQTESGDVEYSDVPAADSEKLELPPVNEIKSQTGQRQGSSPQDSTPAKREDRYQNVWIISPANDEVVRNNQGVVRLTLGFTPKFHAEFKHQIVVLVDGLEVARFDTPQALVINNVDRGSHAIMVRIVDRSGAVVFSSQPITIHMKRFSVLHPKPVQ
jgi:hypothetical protein